MIVIGIDPGTATTGYGVIDEDNDGNFNVLDYGVVITRADLSLENRLKIIYDSLTSLIILHKPASAAVEKLFFKQNVTNAISVGQARGVILLAFANSGIPVAEYSPAEVKSAVSGYGGAEKAQVQAMVKAILNLNETPKPDDAADALAIAICHINSTGSLVNQ
ncbi:MAG TPA: crossover junction endodeoxyribonuclease RuvC [Cyclobacteriaceae bacterium]|nr:crossover junction endodeoxyribonuclease RuvC [Cyclobacteriaceae bacterium]